MSLSYRAALAWGVKDTTWLDRLERYQTPVVAVGRTYKLHGKYLPGLTTVIKEHLKQDRVPRLPQHHVPPPLPSPSGATGAERGELVHQQIHDYVRLGGDMHAFNALHKANKGMDPWTYKIIKYLEKERLHPVQSEYVVHDTQAHMAHRCDFICVRPDGRLVLFELKTGSAHGTFDALDPESIWHTQCPISDRACTPAASACVQHALNVILFLRVFRTPVYAELRVTQTAKRRAHLERILRDMDLDSIDAYVLHVNDEPRVDDRRVPVHVMSGEGIELFTHIWHKHESTLRAAKTGTTISRKRPRVASTGTKKKRPRR